MNPRLKLAAGIAIFAGFVYGVEVYVGWAALLRPWRALSLPALALALGLTFISYAVRALRLYDYFRRHMPRGYTGCVRLMLQHNLLNNLLPMRAGELSFPLLMSRYFGIEMSRSVPALLWFRVLDLHTLLLLALVMVGGHGLSPATVTLAAALWLAVPWGLVHFSARLQRRLAGGRERGWSRKVQRLLAGLPQNPLELLRSWGWTLVNWALKLGVFAWVILQFMDLAPFQALLAAIAGDLTTVLPVHGVAGTGTYEAGVMAALLPHGVAPRDALQAAVNLHLFVLGASLLGGGLSFLVPVPRRA